MEWANFQTQVPGKWVLAGEHAVLRGAAAVALPHPDLGLSLVFRAGDSAASDLLHIDPLDGSEIIEGLLRTILQDFDGSSPFGMLQVQSTIPVGAGLGSSAALCVAVSQWVAAQYGLTQKQVVAWATQLEHQFHGRSSGMDVAVISAREPIAFTISQGIRKMGVTRLPRFTFHDTGLRSRTVDCVTKVQAFREQQPTLGAKIDERMELASRWAMEGLAAYDDQDSRLGLTRIANAMSHARDCFYSWDLVPAGVQALEESLLKQGARSVKLTGAGGGGMVVALWD
jgi:mevalonate kinase